MLLLKNNWSFFYTRPSYDSKVSKILEFPVAFGEVNSSSCACWVQLVRTGGLCWADSWGSGKGLGSFRAPVIPVFASSGISEKQQ